MPILIAISRCVLLLAGAALLGGCAHGPQAAAGPRLAVSSDGRHIVHSDGRPFFWLADTAWELLHRTSREDAAFYLDDRARKGFTVIQAVILAELGGLREPNVYGDLPLAGNDPAKPNEDYFRHVDAVVELAAARGLVMALLPTWGDKFNRKWGEGPEIFTPANARTYGAYLGRRYAGRPVIWVLGGDRNPENETHLAIARAMGEGIDSATGGQQLITYHPQGGSKSWQWFHQAPWLDFHLFQSGHDYRDFANYQFTLEGRGTQPVKPVIDGEPRYEDHPIALFRLGAKWRDDRDGWFGEHDVRQAAWWSLLAGAAGHTYGHHAIWQMWQAPREPISKARTPWRMALEHPGAAQMGHMRRFLERHGFGSLAPAQDLLAVEHEGAGHQRAARSADGRFLIVYSPLGEAVTLRTGTLGGRSASWFDPRTGRSRAIGAVGDAPERRFDPPGEPARGNDWVLLVRS